MKHPGLWDRYTQRNYALFRGLSIRTRLGLVLVVVLVLLTLALGVMLSSVIASYEASVGFINTEQTIFVSESLSSGIQSLLNVSKYPIIWISDSKPTDTYRYLSAPEQYSSTMLSNDLETQSTGLFEQNRLARLIAVFDLQGQGTYVKNNRKHIIAATPYGQALPEGKRAGEAWFQQTLAAMGKPLLWREDQLSIEDVYLQDGDQMLFVSRAIVNVGRMEPVGVILVAVDLSDTLTQFLQTKVYDEQQIGFFSQDGELLWGTMEDDGVRTFLLSHAEQGSARGGVNAFQTTGAQRMVYHYAETTEGYFCVLQTPYQLMLQAVFREKLIIFIGLALGYLAVSIVINSIVRSIRKPVHDLVKTCNEIVAESDFSITIQDPYADELSELTASFNNLTQRIEYLIHEVYEKQMELSQTQLQLLRSQVNPHFLYNTLETIRTKAFLTGQPELSNMALLLANLLRYAISAPEEMVTVETEVRKLEDYLTLQRLLYEDRFIANIDIEPGILSCRILKFLLQPLVENAISHGVNLMETGGVIDILGYREEDTIVLQVSDNGQGIDETLLTALRDYMDNRNDQFTSIGLKNVHRRIRLVYGDAYGVTVTSRVNMGTMILVRVPAEGCQEGGLDA